MVALAASLALGFAGASESASPDIYAFYWHSSRVDRINLTNDPAYDGSPVSSADQRRIAFISARSGFEAVWIMNGDGSKPRRVTERMTDGASSLRSIAWSPDGRRIAFMADVAGRDSRYGHSYVYVVPAAGGTARRLGEGSAPVSFSSKGAFVAFAARSPSYWGGIVVARADGSASREFAKGSAQPKYAPHGTRILFLRDGRRVSVASSDGRIRWTLHGYSATSATWLPDGRVVFLASGVRRPGLYVIRPGTQRARKVVALADGWSLAVSPDARYVAVSATGATYVVRLRGGYFSRVGDEGDILAWSPTGRALAFVTRAGPRLVITDVPGTPVELGFEGFPEFFGLDWNGGRVVTAL